MKKLTAGIFTVMLGLVAVDANAAITSKAWVESKLATKQDTLTAGDHIEIDKATNTIKAINLASSADLTALEGKVATAEGNITTLKGADTVTGSVANTVKTKIEALDVAATSGTGVISSISQTDGKVAATYKTITNADVASNAAIAQSKISGLTSALAAKEATANKTNTYDAAATDKATKFPTVSAAEAIADAKVSAASGNYATAAQGKKADTALQEARYDSEIGKVSATDMGTAATTVVTAIKEVADRTTQVKSMADTAGQAADAAQIAADKAMAAAGDAQSSADNAYNKATAAQNTANKAVVANAAITAGTGTKITYDAKGLVTGSTTLAESDIPALAISKITNLQTTLDGKQNKLVTSGTNANFVAGNNVTITQDATSGKITVSSKNTTYGTGNTSTAGLTKLYTTTGTNTDGTMTQNAIKTALDDKQAKGNYITVPAADGTDGTKVLTAKTENGATTYYWENIGR